MPLRGLGLSAKCQRHWQAPYMCGSTVSFLCLRSPPSVEAGTALNKVSIQLVNGLACEVL